MDKKLQYSLAAMRFSLGIFLLVWAFQKVLAPELATRVSTTFYGFEPTEGALLAVGIVQIAFILAFMTGWQKTITYGGLLVIHSSSVLSTWSRLIDPYSPPNSLFWAGVPLIVMFAVLFVLRREDTFLTLRSPSTAA